MSHESTAEPEILLFERSPYQSLDAIVQHDGRAIYLFLGDNGGRFGTRACWVRNLIDGPMVFQQSDLQRGIPPVLPHPYCRSDAPRQLPTAEHLRVIWFEEGNAVALVEGDDILSVIPPWSGEAGFHGYARDCTHENQVVWPMPPNPALAQRITLAEQFWRELQNSSPLDAVEKNLSPIYQQEFGSFQESLSTIQDHVIPVRIHRYGSPEGETIVTCGMSLRPQPNVELASRTPALLRRIELGMRIPKSGLLATAKNAIDLLAHQSGLPWRTWNWLDDRHVCRVQLPGAADSADDVLHFQLRDHSSALRHADMRVRGDVVRLLMLEPISREQYAAAASNA